MRLKMNKLNQSDELILGENKEKIREKISKLKNSFLGIKYKHEKRNDEGIILEGVAYPDKNDILSLEKIMEIDSIPGLCIAAINDFKAGGF